MILLDARYWDCECEHAYIHARKVQKCYTCGQARAHAPYSHASEVDEGKEFAPERGGK